VSVPGPTSRKGTGKSKQIEMTEVETETETERKKDRTPLTIFFDATEDVVYVVGEEASGVKHRLNQAGDRAERHLLVMRVLVPL
jgi:hypothetical protein